jgi:hypothetical protein
VVNLANRLVKQVTVTWAVRNRSTTSVLEQFTATLNSGPPGGSLSSVSMVMRTVASLPSIWLSHAVNFTLPFWVVLPLQLYTTGIAMCVVRPTACALASQPDHIRLAALRACHALRSGMELFTLISGPLHSGGSSSHAGGAHSAGLEAAATQELFTMVVFTYIMMLLLIPCTFQYVLELSWKARFIEAKRMRTASLLPLAGAWWLKCYAVYFAISAVWLACDAAVMLLPPIDCAAP